jgi:hypothetical protein
MTDEKVIPFVQTVSVIPNGLVDKLYKLDGKKGCDHVNIYVDPEVAYIECRECGDHLDPIQYLYKMACSERQMDFRRNEMQAYEKQIETKNRCKCEKCGEMTRIVR